MCRLVHAFLFAAGLLCLAPLSMAQGGPPGFSGVTFDQQPYALAQRRGRVVLVMLWRTDCAVCLSKMPELRANAQGWQNKPFDLVTVSLDPRRADAADYERVRQQVGAARFPVWSLWHGDATMPAEWQQPPKLPVLLLFDTQGRLVKRHEGRVPAEAWDDVAELLP
jgi:thiol-disulfide isomerase/thioredoxin